jgi:hypothetical protein
MFIITWSYKANSTWVDEMTTLLAKGTCITLIRHGHAINLFSRVYK